MAEVNRDEALKDLLVRTAAERKGWERLSEDGATDDDILQMIKLGVPPNGRSGSKHGVCNLKWKPKLAFWWGSYAVGEPTMAEGDLISHVREVMGIPVGQSTRTLLPDEEPAQEADVADEQEADSASASAGAQQKSMFRKSLRYASYADLEERRANDELSDAHLSDLVAEMNARRVVAIVRAATDTLTVEDLTDGLAYNETAIEDAMEAGSIREFKALLRFVKDGGDATLPMPDREEVIEQTNDFQRANEGWAALSGRPAKKEPEEPAAEKSESATMVVDHDLVAIAPLSEPVDLTGFQFRFDFSGLDSDDIAAIKQRTVQIYQRAQRIQVYTVEIGDALRDVRRRIEPGRWQEYLAAETPFSQDTAKRLMDVSELAETNPQFAGSIGRFDKSAQYLLVRASTPEAAREELLERAEAGQPITHATAEEVVERHKAAQPGEPGVCRICGCTALTPCVIDEDAGITCSWADDFEDVCTKCVAEIEAKAATETADANESAGDEAKAVEAELVSSGFAMKDLLSLLKATPAGMQIDDLIKQGFSPGDIDQAVKLLLIDRTTAGKCTYSWKAADVEAAINETGPMSRLELEGLGCKSYAIADAKSQGIIEERGSKWHVIPEEKRKRKTIKVPPKATADRRPVTAAASAPVRTHTPSKKVSDLLNGRNLAVTLSWLSALKGKVTVGVVVGNDRSKFKSQTFDEGLVDSLPDPVRVMVVEALSGDPVVPKTPAAKKKVTGGKTARQMKSTAKRQAKRNPASRAASKAKVAASKKSAAKKSSKKSGRK
jgi:hypothetical protein